MSFVMVILHFHSVTDYPYTSVNAIYQRNKQMSDESLYLVKLQYQSGAVGGGSMEIHFAVDSKTG